MLRPVGARVLAALMMAASSVAGPAVALGDREPHRRALYQALFRKPRQPTFRDGERTPTGPGRRPPRQKRRALEVAYLAMTGKRLSGRTYVRIKKALRSGAVKHRNSDAARFLERVPVVASALRQGRAT